MTDDRLRDLVRESHEADRLPGFAATLRAARAAEGAAPERRGPAFLTLAGALAVAALVLLVWIAARDGDPRPPELAAPALDTPGPFDQLPSPFPGLALAELTLDGAGLPAAPEGLPNEDSW